MPPRLQEKYRNEVAPALVKQFGLGNPNAVPRLKKIVISMGMGDAHSDQAKLDGAVSQLTALSGQKPVVTKSKKDVSNFKLRAGMKVGLMVTLRGARMWEFLDRLISLAIPRVKDFRGINPSSFDGRGNFNMGLSEQSVFPEVDPASVTFTQGMNIAMQIDSRNDEQSRAMLTLLGMPFRKD